MVRLCAASHSLRCLVVCLLIKLRLLRVVHAAV